MTLIKLNVGAKNQLEQNRTEQTVCNWVASL